MSSGSDITSGPHNDLVGGDASKGRIPGAEKATSGHFFVSIDPSSHMREQRAEEHLPLPTGRDAPPASDVAPGSRTHVTTERHLPSDILGARENAPRQPSPLRQVNHTPSPLPPAPDSRTVVDRDPYEQPATAGDTLGGATSADVNKGIGRPPIGMSSAERHHDGKPHRKRQMGGVDQYGSHEIPRGTESE